MYLNKKGRNPNNKGTSPYKQRTFYNNKGTSSNKNSAYQYIIRETDIKNSNILVEVNCYPMTREKFEKLIRSTSHRDDWAINILFIGIGFAIKIFTVWGIFIFHGYSGNSKVNILFTIESWEYGALLVCGVAFGILKLWSFLWPSKRDKLQREIQDFFKQFE